MIQRIYDHCLSEKWLQEGDQVLDCFAGVGLGAYDALRHGLHWTGIEIERAFCHLGHGHHCPGFCAEEWRRWHHRLDAAIDYRAGFGLYWCPDCLKALRSVPANRRVPSSPPHRFAGNIDLWNQRYAGRLRKWGTAQILQGDSRRLSEVIEATQVCIASPPYSSGTVNGRNGINHAKLTGPAPGRNSQALTMDDYGTTPGQLGRMPDRGGFAACVASPPYANSINTAGDGIDWSKAKSEAPAPRHQAPGQSVSSHYGSTPGQLGAMKTGGGFAACVASPPFMNSEPCQDDNFRLNDGRKAPPQGQGGYGQTAGNTGNMTGGDFWTAARAIVEEVYAVLVPGGHAIWVTKRFVRNKAIVEFSEQWSALCVAVGFVPVCWHRAWLVEERGTQHTMGGEAITKTVERKSFFRRLAEKNGSPCIDWEDVLCFKKPEHDDEDSLTLINPPQATRL